MIKRIVKMSFQPSRVDEFLSIFSQSNERIRAFPGCRHLELLRCASPSHVLFTISIWDSPEALENYRQSELFRNTWKKTKALFSDKAEAWTTRVVWDAGETED